MPSKGEFDQRPTTGGSQGAGKGQFSKMACDPEPMAQECLDRVHASLSEDLQWDQSNMRTALSSS